MKLYYTLEEGGKWHKWILSRKEIQSILKQNVIETVTYSKTGSALKAIRIGKSPIIYDFILLKLRKQPWIRQYETRF